MNVPNHERKAFRDMTPEERSAIVEAWIVAHPVNGGDVQVLTDGGWATVILTDHIPFDSIYRTRPRQLVIPWGHIKEEYQWAAMNESGRVLFFRGEPLCRSNDGVWENGSDWCMSPLAINTTGIDWRESLTARPEGV